MRWGFLTILLFYGCNCIAQHNNELYIKGAGITIQSNAVVHVMGDVHLDKDGLGNTGSLNNDGVLELRGNFYIRDNDTEQTDGTTSQPGTSTGIIRFKNRGYSIETTHASESQAIVLTTGVTDAAGKRAFYTIELENDNNSLPGTSDNLIYISGGDVEVKNLLEFKNDCRLRTDTGPSFSTPPTGADYSNTIFISNPSLTALAGVSTTPGDDVRYVEGRLALNVSGSGDYYFPIGLQPGFAGSDGMAAFELNTVAAPLQRMDAWLSSGQTDLAFPQIYCDIGDFPDAASGNQPWTSCVGGPDGLYDFAHLNLESSHEWVVQNSGGDFDYDIEVYPGNGLDATVPTVGAVCGSPWHLRFLAKDGVLMENGSVAIVTDPLPPYNTTNGFPPGYRLCPPASKAEGNRLFGLSSFSRFRLHGGATDQTLLPVELVYLNAWPVDNKLIRVNWATATEVNNFGFWLERSTDGIQFMDITWVSGNGTSSTPHHYGYDDLYVSRGQLYYYRLRQVNFDGTSEYSNVVSARLDGDADAGIVLYPNPVLESDCYLELTGYDGGRVELIITNAMGQIVKNHKIDLISGFNRLVLPVKDIAAGTYVVSLMGKASERKLYNGKLVVLENR